MRSTSGEHFIALDHVRALAAFMVFSWHFVHGHFSSPGPIPFEYAPSLFFFSLFEEGHTGVALFMTLSGYLFAKLLEGKRIHYGAFLWNRALRLLPLLVLVIILVGVRTAVNGGDVLSYALTVAKGIVEPTLPNGGWSITVEFHFYLLLPLLLWFSRQSKWLLFLTLIGAIAARSLIFEQRGEVQWLSYWTIVGRIDQFLLGMIGFHLRIRLENRHALAISAIVVFAAFYWYFDFLGGFYHIVSYPSPSPIWIFLPTLEGLAYGLGIAYYDSSFRPSSKGVSGFVGKIGTVSYSIYLLHFFVVFFLARIVNQWIMSLSNFYIAIFWALICFMLLVPIGLLSFRFIESPFLSLRRRYTVSDIRVSAGSKHASDRA